jgi:hypothetical protein
MQVAFCLRFDCRHQMQAAVCLRFDCRHQMQAAVCLRFDCRHQMQAAVYQAARCETTFFQTELRSLWSYERNGEHNEGDL